MQDYLNKIKTLGFSKKKKFTYDNGGIKPDRDWGFVVGASIIVLVVIVVFSATFYMKVSSGEFFRNSEGLTGGEIKINNVLLKKINDEIVDRDNKFLEIEEKGINSVDPGV